MAEETKSKCPDCGRVFPTKQVMMQHRKDAHQAAVQEKKKRPITAGKMLTYIIGLIIVIAISWAGYGIYAGGTSNPVKMSSFDFSAVPHEGNASAKISIIEFGDYQCPVCKAFFLQTEPQIKNGYVAAGKVKFYFMDFAFLGPDSLTLAQGTWCANEQGLYYAYHDYVYSNQGRENSGWGTPARVKAFAPEINNLNATQFGSCLDSNRYRSRLQQLVELGTSSGVGGTPTFLIGNNDIGYITIVGDQPYSQFQQTIDSQLAKVS